MNKFNLTKPLCTMFLAWTFIFQSVAFAVDPVKVSQASDQNRLKVQSVTNKIMSRYSKLSDERKLKLLKRTQRKLSRNTKKLQKISDRKFSKKLADLKKIETKNISKKSKTSQLSSEENEIMEGISEVVGSLKSNKIQNVERFQMISGAQEALNEINAEIDNLEYKLAGMDTKNERNPSSLKSKTWTNISYAILIGLAIGSFFTPIALFILLGVIGVVLVMVGMLLIVVYSVGNSGTNVWPWT